MVPFEKSNMKLRFIILRLYSSIYKRIHNWGLFLLLLMLYLSSIGLKSDSALQLLSKIGLMSFHVFCGFILILVTFLIGYNYLLTRFLKGTTDKYELNGEIAKDNSETTSASSRLVDIFFFLALLAVCIFGLLYYFIKTYAYSGYFLNQYFASSLHVITGWFFLSVIFIKYYLNIIRWSVDLIRYLRD